MQIQKKRGRKINDGDWGTSNQNFWGQNNSNNNQPTSGWGSNDGWGQQQNNTGWNQPPKNDGWGNNGWGGNNDGWNQPKKNDGWGGNNDGWGNQGGNNNNKGWGNQGGNNDGWGENNNSGWGNQGFGFQNAFFGNKQAWGNNLSGRDWVQQQIKRQTFNILNPGQKSKINLNDIQNIIQKQIIFLQPSPAQAKLEQLEKQGKTFYDNRFPPNQTSLTGEWGHVKQWSQIQWKKISEVMPKAKIFQGKIEPGDIKQGYLGDCYFLAGLAALAQRPDRIFNLFLLTQINSVKYYSVKMLYKGKWMTIDMDEYIPFLYGSPAFTKAKDHQLWVVLLEKAWAKMYTSYKRIQAGYPEEALHDLTGAPVRNIYFKTASFDKQKQWKYLLTASQKQYSMVASSRPGSDTQKSQSGIVQGHAYTFLNATYLNVNGNKERIVQLRNPWGKGQSKGKWSDNDPNWKYISQSQKKRIGYKKDTNDGIFFMTYNDFIAEFRALAVAQINDNASYIYKSVKDPKLKGAYFKIQIVQKGIYSLHVDKTPERSFPDKKQNNYRYPEAKLQIGKITNNSCKKLESVVSSKRTLYKQYQLTPGVYVAYVKVFYDKNYEQDFDINLAMYAEYFCDIQIASHNDAVAFTGNQSVQWTGSIQQNKKPWNHMGNTNWKGSGWGNNNQGGNNGWQDDGWGNQGNNNNNNGWGNNNNNNGWGNNNNNNNGWGNQGNNNNGWGNNNNNNGWENNNNGWGNQGNNNNNNGWGNQGFNNNNNGWGQQQNNSGWNQPKKNDDGWGNQGGKKGNNNNGWGDGW